MYQEASVLHKNSNCMFLRSEKTPFIICILFYWQSSIWMKGGCWYIAKSISKNCPALNEWNGTWQKILPLSTGDANNALYSASNSEKYFIFNYKQHLEQKLREWHFTTHKSFLPCVYNGWTKNWVQYCSCGTTWAEKDHPPPLAGNFSGYLI